MCLPTVVCLVVANLLLPFAFEAVTRCLSCTVVWYFSGRAGPEWGSGGG